MHEAFASAQASARPENVGTSPSATESRIYAVQHIRRMRGGAQAHLMRASDGGHYVVKFMNNPQHVRILANEFLVTRLARKLGLPVPETAVLEVSSWLIERTPELRCDLAGRCIPFTSGPCLGSRYIADLKASATVFDYLPETCFDRIANASDFARVLVLDKWTCNADGRQCVFHRPVRARKYRVSFVDHGHCFNAGEWTFPDAPLRGLFTCNAAYATVTGWHSFEPTLSRAEQVSAADIQDCAEGMPEDWYGHDALALTGLIEALVSRRRRIRDLITELRHSTRRPFPNWHDG